jgi:type I restriction enzyme S subunit
VIAATGRHGTHDQAKVKGPGIATGRSGSLGTVAYVVEDFWPLNTTLWVKEYRRATPETGYFLLQNLNLAGYNSGAAVPTLNRNDISQLPQVLPPRNLVAQFSELARDIFVTVRILERSNEVLRATRDFLLPVLVSGEVSVTHLDIALPEPTP